LEVSAAHRRQGLVSMKWRACRGAPRYSCVVMATDRGWMDICYDNSSPPYFNGELRVRIGFAGRIVVLFVGHAC
jgi:hypothetical protein